MAESEKLGTAVLELKTDSSQFNTGMASAQEKGEGLLGTFAKLGGVLGGAAVVGGAVKLGKAAVDVAADFETQMNTLTIAARSSGTSLEDLRAASLATGADTSLVGISASQSAEALENFYKAGLDTAAIFGGSGGLNAYLNEGAELSGALRAAIDLQAASELDLAAASDAITIAMATFGIDAERATEITNNFVQAADASVTSVPELTAAMGNLGPTWAAFYGGARDSVESLGNMNNALAILSQRGISGAEAGTALKSMFLNILNPSKDGAEVMAQLGVSLYNAEGELKDFSVIMGEFSEKLQVGNVITTESVGLAEGEAKALGKLQAKYAETARELEAYQAKTLGASLSDKERATKTENLAEKLEKLQFQMDPLIAKQDQVLSSTLEVDEAYANMAAKALAGSYGIKAFNTLAAEGSEGWDAMKAATETAATAQEQMGARTSGFNSAMEALGGTVETFMITAGTPIIENFLTPAIKLLAELGEVAIPALEGFIALLETGPAEDSPLATSITAIQTALEPVVTFFTEEMGKIKAWVDENMPLIQATFETVSAAIETVWTEVWPRLEIAFTTAWDIAKVVIETAINTLLGVIQAIMLLIQGDWEGAWKTMSGVVTTILEGIKTIVSDQITAVVGVVTGKKVDIETEFKALIQSGVDAVGGFVEDFKQAGKDAVDGFIAGITGAPEKLAEGAGNIAKDAYNAVAFWQKSKSPSQRFMEQGQAAVDGYALPLEGARTRLTKAGAGIAQGIGVGFQGSITNVLGQMATVVDIILSRIRAWAGDEVTAQGMKKITDTFQDMIAAFNGLMLLVQRLGPVPTTVVVERWLAGFEEMMILFQTALVGAVSGFNYQKVKTDIYKAARNLNDVVTLATGAVGVLVSIRDEPMPTRDMALAAVALLEDVLHETVLAMIRIRDRLATTELTGMEILDLSANVGKYLTAIASVLNLKPSELVVTTKNAAEYRRTVSEYIDQLVIFAETAALRLVAITFDMMDVMRQAQDVVGLVKGVAGVLGVNLDLELPETSPLLSLDAFLLMIKGIVDKAVPTLVYIKNKWGEALEHAAGVVSFVTSVLGLLGGRLNVEMYVPDDRFYLDFEAYLRGVEAVVNYAVPKLRALKLHWGDALTQASGAVREILDVLQILSTPELSIERPKGVFWDELVEWIGSLGAIMAVVLPAINGIANQWGEALDVAGDAVGKITAVLRIFGTSMRIEPGGPTFGHDLMTFLGNLRASFPFIIAELQAIDRDFGAVMTDEFVAIAAKIATVLDVLSLSDLIETLQIKKRISPEQYRTAFTNVVMKLIADLKFTATKLMAPEGLPSIATIFGDALDWSVTLVDKIASLFERLGVIIQTFRDFATGDALDGSKVLALIRQLYALLRDWQSLGPMPVPVMPTPSQPSGPRPRLGPGLLPLPGPIRGVMPDVPRFPRGVMPDVPRFPRGVMPDVPRFPRGVMPDVPRAPYGPGPEGAGFATLVANAIKTAVADGLNEGRWQLDLTLQDVSGLRQEFSARMGRLERQQYELAVRLAAH